MSDRYSNPTAYQSAASVGTHPEGTRPGTPALAWTAAPPLPYEDDHFPAPWWWATDLYRRKRRRPRCDGEG